MSASGFLPTPSARRATHGFKGGDVGGGISTHALREEGDRLCAGGLGAHGISTHALREEGDLWSGRDRCSNQTYFYPRPPRGGRRLAQMGLVLARGFLPTPSARRATRFRNRDTGHGINFYPRPPRGGRRVFIGMSSFIFTFLPTPSARRATYRHRHERQRQPISTHALREEGDQDVLQAGWLLHGISTHALREEGDFSFQAPAGTQSLFLPTPSARRATPCWSNALRSWPFLPTPSARRATRAAETERPRRPISTHALREEGDQVFQRGVQDSRMDFYPRPPRGGRRPLRA